MILLLLQVMKENSTIPKPHLVEDFVLDLMAGHMEDGDTLEFTRVSEMWQVVIGKKGKRELSSLT